MKNPHLYILCGLPFAGKTTLAKALANRMGFKRVAIDDINTERGIWDDKVGMSPKEWMNTYNEAYRRIDAFLRQGESVIDDSANFTKELRDHLRVIAERSHAQKTVIYVDIPLSEVRRRWQENRHTVARNDVRDSDFANVVEHFEAPGDGENVLRYDGSLAIDEWMRTTFVVE